MLTLKWAQAQQLKNNLKEALLHRGDNSSLDYSNFFLRVPDVSIEMFVLNTAFLQMLSLSLDEV